MQNKKEQMAHNRLNRLTQTTTAVEWLVEKMLSQDWYTYKSLEYIEQAKEMEKEQIELAYRTGWINYLPNTNAEEYYNASYGEKNNEQ